ncbi:hypothetical protein F4818DRAFT_305128 [Hypoxylon cercidicola]|nr:hypothetical protein F4818DRAFT_305128 [Hypoxylon cercidicola]
MMYPWALHTPQLEPWQQQDEIDRMAQVLSGFNTWRLEKRSADDWKARGGASTTAEITALENDAKMNLPRDYKAFLQLHDGEERFDAEGCESGMQFFKAKEVKWTNLSSNFLLRAIVGNAAYKSIRKEMRHDQFLTYDMLAPQIDEPGWIYLIKPEDCRKVAAFWQPLLSHPMFSQELRDEVREYTTRHFGPVSPFEALKSWPTWLVLEHYEWEETKTNRIYPSFTHLLKEIALWAEAERSTAGGEVMTIQESDLRTWNPFLSSYLSSPWKPAPR